MGYKKHLWKIMTGLVVLGLIAVGTAVVFWPGEGTEDSSRKSISDPDALLGNRSFNMTD